MKYINIIYRIPMALLLSGLLHMAPVQSADEESAATKMISGNIWYRERMMLPPGAEINVVLEDVSRMDVAATVIAQTSLKPEGAPPPYAYSLQYDPANIQPGMRYGMRVRIEANGQLMFINTEHIPAFGQASGEPVNIMVSRVRSQQGGKGPHPPKPDASLVNTYWKPVELQGQPVSTGAGQRELHMVLTGAGNRIRGFSGCNRFFGHYAVSNDQLYFNQLASTPKMCLEAMEQEQQFLVTLGSTSRFEIEGEALMLYAAEGREILRFVAVYLY